MYKIVLLLLIISLGAGWYVYSTRQDVLISGQSKLASLPVASPPPSSLPTSTPTPSPTPSPTPKPLTFAEMNSLYGPCVSLPILMYHHIQSEESAKAAKQTGLTVHTPTFKNQMQYLKDKGYTTIVSKTLENFFDSGEALPKKSVMVTLDDGYADNYSDAFPVLKDLGLKATLFLATGLTENPGYITWAQAKEMAANGVFDIANHTWSHRNMQASKADIEREIGTADNQLAEKGLNPGKAFAFPYGTMSGAADTTLAKLGYKLAYDTVPGRIQCKQKRFALTRIRIGNANLSAYGL